MQKVEIIFCDQYKKFIDGCEEELKENKLLGNHFKFSTYFGDIRDINEKYAAYVNPANCFGSMGGGIDKVYSREMFYGINKVVMDRVKKLDTKIKLERSFDDLYKNVEYHILPIGSAIITSLEDYEKYKTCFLITAPTMIYPMDIKGTDNAYKAFLACLTSVSDYNKQHNNVIKKIICPGLGTGVGNVDGKESAKQIFRAIGEFIN